MKLLNIIALCLLATSAGAQNVKIIVNNDEKVQRQEVVEVCAKQLYQKMGISYGSPVIVKNALGQQVGYQLTHDSLLLVDASVRPCGTAEFSVEKGTPRQPKIYVTGRQYPERVDDIAWENDRTAYRIYGPALQRNKERAFGVDVWVKNTPDLEVEKRYVTELSNHSAIEALKKEGKTQEALDMEEATTYHFDHGYGLDCYKVGPTLGGGAPALMDNGELVLPYCYRDYQILDNGPLRFTVRVDYNPTSIGKDKNIVEHRIISLDKGSNFNRCTVWYDGLSEKRDMAAGIVVHPEDTETMHLASNMALYADPTDNPTKQNFQIFVGLLFPKGIDYTRYLYTEQDRQNGNAGHVIGVKSYTPGTRFTYYFGSAWSKNDVRTMDEWKLRSEQTIDALHAPMNVTISVE
ncbi:MAG: DUF4861 domain-containing protein [Prevotellaceae bacterium]|nr:DUF4861 domain-containing protein [Prevotellaceae bacterium]